MNFDNPLMLIDFYKVDHIRQYPKNTTLIYSNLTPRYVLKNDNLPKTFDNKILWMGMQQCLIEFCDIWNRWFSGSPKARRQDIAEYARLVKTSMGLDIDTSHLELLSKRNCLPIQIKSIEEGALVPIGVPVLTIQNTEREYAWLTNYLETYLSAQLWKTPTVATIALQFRRLFEDYANQTCDNSGHVQYQGHDFSLRGMSGIEDGVRSGLGHLSCFKGSDNVAAINEAYWNYCGVYTGDIIGSSVPATEHSVMCMGGKDTEKDTYERLLDLYPTGIVSIVSDTWDLWNVVDNILPALKDKILARNGKLVIRPDSGEPIKVMCELIKKLANTFGYTVNKKGYNELNERVGIIFGDGITYKKAKAMLDILATEGWASNNIVFGIGSYTYQYITRDTFGWAMKATAGRVDHGVFNSEFMEIYKDPITDIGAKKKSLKGLLHVGTENGEYVVQDQVNSSLENRGALITAFSNGRNYSNVSLEEIRKKVDRYV